MTIVRSFGIEKVDAGGAHAKLAVEDRPAIGDLDRDRRKRHQGRCGESDRAADNEVDGSLRHGGAGPIPRVDQIAEPAPVDDAQRNLPADLFVELARLDQTDAARETDVGHPFDKLGGGVGRCARDLVGLRQAPVDEQLDVVVGHDPLELVEGAHRAEVLADVADDLVPRGDGFVLERPREGDREVGGADHGGAQARRCLGDPGQAGEGAAGCGGDQGCDDDGGVDRGTGQGERTGGDGDTRRDRYGAGNRRRERSQAHRQPLGVEHATGDEGAGGEHERGAQVELGAECGREDGKRRPCPGENRGHGEAAKSVPCPLGGVHLAHHRGGRGERASPRGVIHPGDWDSSWMTPSWGWGPRSPQPSALELPLGPSARAAGARGHPPPAVPSSTRAG